MTHEPENQPPVEPADWITLGRREVCGYAGYDYTEFLCARRNGPGFVLNNFAHQVVCEVPDEWYDDDHELLPEFRDEDGALKVPDEIDGWQVLAYRNGEFLSDLAPVDAGAALEITDWSAQTLIKALSALYWDETAISEVQAELAKLAGGEGPAAIGNEHPVTASEPLFVSLFSIIVKRAAVARSFPGDVEEFERVYEPARKNGALFLLVRMSLNDVDHVLDRLFAQGLIPGQDIAVAGMVQGPLLECPGVVFETDDTEDVLFPSWTANVASDPEAPEAPEAFWNGCTAFSPNTLDYLWEAPRRPEVELSHEAVKQTPRRVVFGTGPVHWLYDDDDDSD